MSDPLWTTADRRELGRLFDQATPDLERAAVIARSLATGFAGVFPATHRGIELLPLLVHKMAGYNCDLFTHACRLLRAQTAAWAMLKDRPTHHLIFPFEDMYLAEHALGESLRQRAGSFVVPHHRARGGAALERRYTARCDAAEFERFEIDLTPTGPGAPARREPRPSRDDRPVLFIASMNNYLQPMAPVMAELLREGTPVVLLAPSAADLWPGIRTLPHGVERITIEDELTPDLAGVLQRERRRVALLWEERCDAVAACFRSGGVDLWPVVRRDVARFVQDYIPYCTAMIEMADALHATLDPGACVVARLRRATENALSAAFRARAVPVTMLVHGHVSTFPERSFDSGSFTGADRVCVWGPAQRRQVLATHEAPEPAHIQVVGNPAWDSLISGRATAPARSQTRRALAASLGLDPARLWAVFTSQYITTPQFPDVVAALAKEPRAVLIVKPHPAEQPAWYQRRCADLPGALVLEPGQTDLHELLRAADLTLTFSSTTNMESLILGTPVVTYTFGALAAQDRAAYLEECGLPLARTPEELATLLAHAAADPAAFRAALGPAIERALTTFIGNYPSADAATRAAVLITADRNRSRTLAGSTS